MAAGGALTDERLREKLLRPDPVSGAEALLRCLLLEGTECVFGYPGGAVLYVYDAFYDFAGLRHMLARHEQGAIHAADGYARASGKVGVCIATSGPGATNLVTGIAAAYKDGVPLVVVTGNVALTSRGTDAFQEADIIGMTLPITKHSFYVTRAGDIPGIVRKAFRLAVSGRKGPVLIDLPKDVSSHRTVFRYGEQAGLADWEIKTERSADRWETARRVLASAKRPLLLAGGGVVLGDAHRELLALVEQTGMPVATTEAGAGSVPADRDLSSGSGGSYGQSAFDDAVRRCDALVVVGVGPDERFWLEGEPPPAGTPIVHWDTDSSASVRMGPIAYRGYGELSRLLAEAARELRDCRVPDWLGHPAEPKRGRPEQASEHDKLTADSIVELLRETIPANAIVTTEDATLRSRIARAVPLGSPRSVLSPFGADVKGFGLPAAIGALMAYPDRPVVAVCDDAGMQMCAQEMAVCAIHRIAIKMVVLNRNGRKERSSPDFVKLAEAYGVKGFRASDRPEAAAAWRRALECEGPALVDFILSEGPE
ncbi:thiamine pyrophosphate-binding protein [Paenibacillus flagellatus]|uniref:Acetolactate synthase large subunit n=1 Tax=Paenibacillus flagellatus TaxID=2211139 RepID=A0A2V5K606_9BACL|nr:thiamine pyrophosphate-binding protein [Paenibacillus flagellatus]PYI54809.1 acetolactate synthase large subunit [Paenibacillus flagellatus]